MISERQRFLAAFAGEPVDRPPLWLMRQAGRYLSGYREVRAAHGFWDVCKTPALSTQVALEPLGLFPLDAAIVFSDILVIPDALGLEVTFGPDQGPAIGRRLQSPRDLEAWKTEGLIERLAFVPNAVRHLRQAIGDRYALLGFAGAPFTLFAYMCEGKGSDDFKEARTLLYRDPELATRALTLIADAVATLLESELAAGADVVQLFDTWGGLLSRDEYRAFAIPALRRITDRLHAGGHRVLLFVRGGHHLLPILGEAGIDGLSLDWRTPLSEARALYPELVLQGNLDPVLLFAPIAAVRKKTRALLEEAQKTSQGRRTIINLGHGILPGTPVEAVRALCEEVASFGSSAAATR